MKKVAVSLVKFVALEKGAIDRMYEWMAFGAVRGEIIATTAHRPYGRVEAKQWLAQYRAKKKSSRRKL